MKEEKGKGLKKYDKWFCSQNCLESYEKNLKNQPKSNCCH
jgi:YHS domain-containing protein